MRTLLSVIMIATCWITWHQDGYDRFDLCFGFIAALTLTWMMGYKREGL